MLYLTVNEWSETDLVCGIHVTDAACGVGSLPRTKAKKMWGLAKKKKMFCESLILKLPEEVLLPFKNGKWLCD
jgi:hypothetical protein